jgi:D-glycero-D-manno-heptose 1,7-bisphosphate phosphatase
VEGVYYCPLAPSGDDPTAVEHLDRKPGPGMLLRAARDLDLDLAASWMVGDTISDVLAGVNAGCRGNILVRTGKALPPDDAYPGLGYHTVDDLNDAADRILAAGRGEDDPRPARGPGAGRSAGKAS